MKKCKWLPAVFILLFAAFGYAGDPVRIVSNDYEPYTSSKNNGSGVILDIVKEVFGDIDLEVVFRFYPWRRCEMNVAGGNAFAAAPYFKTKERMRKYNFSDPIVYSYNRFFYNKKKFPNGFEWRVLEDFRGYIMGGVSGYWYLPSFKKAGLTVDLVSSDVLNLKKLTHQRVDFILFDELTGVRLLQEHYPEELDAIGMLERAESFVAFCLLISRTYPGSARITEQFNNGLKKFKEDGRYRQILQRYNLPMHFAVP